MDENGRTPLFGSGSGDPFRDASALEEQPLSSSTETNRVENGEQRLVRWNNEDGIRQSAEDLQRTSTQENPSTPTHAFLSRAQSPDMPASLNSSERRSWRADLYRKRLLQSPTSAGSSSIHPSAMNNTVEHGRRSHPPVSLNTMTRVTLFSDPFSDGAVEIPGDTVQPISGQLSPRRPTDGDVAPESSPTGRLNNSSPKEILSSPIDTGKSIHKVGPKIAREFPLYNSVIGGPSSATLKPEDKRVSVEEHLTQHPDGRRHSAQISEVIAPRLSSASEQLISRTTFEGLARSGRNLSSGEDYSRQPPSTSDVNPQKRLMAPPGPFAPSKFARNISIDISPLHSRAVSIASSGRQLSTRTSVDNVMGRSGVGHSDTIDASNPFPNSEASSDRRLSVPAQVFFRRNSEAVSRSRQLSEDIDPLHVPSIPEVNSDRRISISSNDIFKTTFGNETARQNGRQLSIDVDPLHTLKDSHEDRLSPSIPLAFSTTSIKNTGRNRRRSSDDIDPLVPYLQNAKLRNSTASRGSHENSKSQQKSVTFQDDSKNSSKVFRNGLELSEKHESNHTRNYSLPYVPSALGQDNGQQDQLSEMVSPFGQPRFRPDFSFDGSGRRLSESLAVENQEKQEKLNTLDEVEKAPRRASCVMLNRRKSVYTIEEEKIVRAIGKKRLRWTRNLFIVFFIIVNALCISVSWAYPKYWYIFVPVILLGNVLNSLMVLNLIRYFIWSRLVFLFKKAINKKPPPDRTLEPSVIAMVLACYCESHEELLATLESLNTQERVGHHKKMFVIICDGQVKGKGMEKSTDRILVEDIFEPTEEVWFPLGYESWDGAINGLYCSAGVWHGTPYLCLVKKRNLGKRDGLILVRTLLYKYQQRFENPETSLGDDFFQWFCKFSASHDIQTFDWLVGVDADTTFNSTCIYEMHKECVKDDKLIGCSGLIQVGFRTGNWNLWNIYQNTEYMRAQLLRRLHQAHGTGKVSCLPGACQIIRICEESCGDKILIELFGHIPDPKANMIHQVRALAGEDRNYICLIFFLFPYTQTTMALNAIAYTDPPNGLMVFLSQRKRWTLSTCANDMLIVAKSQMNWFERLNSLADIIVWCLPIFVGQTFILFIKAVVNVSDPTFIVCFAIVTMIPLSYAIVATFWGCNTGRLKAQYALGLLMVVVMGQFVAPVVILYAIWHMDDFSWGKTREVEVSDDPDSKPAHS